MGTRGVFICIEGLDGSGKTTQAKLLVRKLKKLCSVVYTFEPSRGKIGRFIKKHYLHGLKRGPAVVEALLFAADRVEHVEKEVEPALDEGKVVVCDRYIYSSSAYQGAAGIDLDWIEKLNEHALRPDLAIFIDAKPEVTIQRLKPRKSVMENLETQRKVQAVYNEFVKRGELIRVIGEKSIQDVEREIMIRVQQFLKKVS